MSHFKILVKHYHSRLLFALWFFYVASSIKSLPQTTHIICITVEWLVPRTNHKGVIQLCPPTAWHFTVLNCFPHYAINFPNQLQEITVSYSMECGLLWGILQLNWTVTHSVIYFRQYDHPLTLAQLSLLFFTNYNTSFSAQMPLFGNLQDTKKCFQVYLLEKSSKPCSWWDSNPQPKSLVCTVATVFSITDINGTHLFFHEEAILIKSYLLITSAIIKVGGWLKRFRCRWLMLRGFVGKSGLSVKE